MIYDYYLAGSIFRLELPFTLTATEESVDFLFPASDRPADLKIIFRPVAELPEMPADGVHYAESCCCHEGDAYVVYRSRSLGGRPYSRTVWDFSNPDIAYCYFLEDSWRDFSFTRTLLNSIGVEMMLYFRRTVLLHSALIRVNGRGILFSAPSGTGKSTQAELWRKYRNADILNGDRAGIRLGDSGWDAWGLPFAGTSGIYKNESVPISAVAVLRQSKENTVSRLRGAQAVRQLYGELSVHRWEPWFAEFGLDFLSELVNEIPVYLLECLPDVSALEALENTLLEGGIAL